MRIASIVLAVLVATTGCVGRGGRDARSTAYVTNGVVLAAGAGVLLASASIDSCSPGGGIFAEDNTCGVFQDEGKDLLAITGVVLVGAALIGILGTASGQEETPPAPVAWTGPMPATTAPYGAEVPVRP